MLVYVIVIAVAVLGLYMCYRAFGGSEGGTADAAVLLDAAHQSLLRSLDALDEVLLSQDRPSTTAETRVRAGRRGLGAAQHCIDLLAADAGLDERQEEARALLTRALDDVGWTWRIVATPSWAANGGLRTAVNSLRDDAARCDQDAARLLADPLAKPVEGPG